MSLPDHLDIHFTDLPLARPVFGEITAIFDKDHPENWSDGAVTLYQVTTRQYWPLTEEVLPPCYVLGQLYALEDGLNDYEDTLAVGDQVVVLYLEMDGQRPVILGRAPSWDVASAPASLAQMPVTRFRRRGVEWEIDKDGATTLTLAQDQALTIKDSSGSVLLELLKVGGAYEVHLGGSAGLERLCKESLVDALAVLFGAAPVTAGDGGATLKAAIAAAMDSSFKSANTTSVTKGK